MNVFNIERAFLQKKERGWEKIYWVIDAHGTLVKPHHGSIEFYPNAVEVMRWLSQRADMFTILWTSSYSEEIESILQKCNEQGIDFDSINENNQEKNSNQACFDKKFYFNILLDDKSGFEPEVDWELVKLELIRIGEWFWRRYI